MQILVFAVTATFSIFAYIWLLVILKFNTADVVDLWEAILTFVFFPLLVLVAYAADKQWLRLPWMKKSGEAGGDGDTSKQRQIELGAFQPGESTYRTKLRVAF